MDWEFFWRFLTAFSWLAVSMTAMRFGSIIKSRPVFFRVSGIFGFAGALAFLMITFGGGEVWFSIVRVMAVAFYILLACGLMRSGSQAKRLYEMGRKRRGGS